MEDEDEILDRVERAGIWAVTFSLSSIGILFFGLFTGLALSVWISSIVTNAFAVFYDRKVHNLNLPWKLIFIDSRESYAQKVDSYFLREIYYFMITGPMEEIRNFFATVAIMCYISAKHWQEKQHKQEKHASKLAPKKQANPAKKASSTKLHQQRPTESRSQLRAVDTDAPQQSAFLGYYRPYANFSKKLLETMKRNMAPDKKRTLSVQPK